MLTPDRPAERTLARVRAGGPADAPSEGALPAGARSAGTPSADSASADAPSTDSPSAHAASAPEGPAAAPRGRLAALVDGHLTSTMRFLLVGGVVFLLDAAMYNLLVFWSPSEGWGHGIMHGSPLLAKVLTIAAASCLTYLGNRLWTFGDRPRPDTARSILLFVLINLIASGLQLSCLGISRYVLGLDSPLADNISGTFIGQIVSTSFRYVTYGRYVFPRR